MTINQSITNAINSNNKTRNREIEGKVYKYTLYKGCRASVGESGTCTNVSFSYDPIYDENIVYLTDISTGKRYSASAFCIDLEEVK